jgi:Potassium-transporting ATPase A subunit
MGKRIGPAKMRYVALYLPIAFVLALAGMLVRQRCTAVTVGTLRTKGTSFVVLATATALILALLTFLAALFARPLADSLHYRRTWPASVVATDGIGGVGDPVPDREPTERSRPQEGTTAICGETQDHRLLQS